MKNNDIKLTVIFCKSVLIEKVDNNFMSYINEGIDKDFYNEKSYKILVSKFLGQTFNFINKNCMIQVRCCKSPMDVFTMVRVIIFSKFKSNFLSGKDVPMENFWDWSKNSAENLFIEKYCNNRGNYHFSNSYNDKFKYCFIDSGIHEVDSDELSKELQDIINHLTNVIKPKTKHYFQHETIFFDEDDCYLSIPTNKVITLKMVKDSVESFLLKERERNERKKFEADILFNGGEITPDHIYIDAHKLLE